MFHYRLALASPFEQTYERFSAAHSLVDASRPGGMHIHCAAGSDGGAKQTSSRVGDDSGDEAAAAATNRRRPRVVFVWPQTIRHSLAGLSLVHRSLLSQENWKKCC